MLKKFLTSIFGVFIFTSNIIIAQPVSVSKTYSKPVLVHYMPWFDTPEFNNYWGWHWTMNNQDPNIIIDTQTGQRQIATHYYPLIGPYASQDSDVIEYHLLLMKYVGIDGVLINWYGVEGWNGDINSLLTNSNAIIDQVDDVGLEFGIVLEDRFSESVSDGHANMTYAANNYFSQDAYFRYGVDETPLVGVFGPITFETEEEWDSILFDVNEDIELLPLWYEKNDCGIHADGEFVWIYEDENLDDYFFRLQNFYNNRAPNLNTAMGIAYPGFHDFYEQGNAGSSYFEIPHDDGETLDTIFQLLFEQNEKFDLLQLATWNDFGEGTMFEPTFEFGFDFLNQLQTFLGVSYGTEELEQIHRLYLLRKQFADSSEIQIQLDEVFDHFVSLNVDEAKSLMDNIEAITNSSVSQKMKERLRVFPNPVKDFLVIENVDINKTSFKIYNSIGLSIDFDLINGRIDLEHLPNGIYFLGVFEEGNDQLVFPIIKQND